MAQNSGEGDFEITMVEGEADSPQARIRPQTKAVTTGHAARFDFGQGIRMEIRIPLARGVASGWDPAVTEPRWFLRRGDEVVVDGPILLPVQTSGAPGGYIAIFTHRDGTEVVFEIPHATKCVCYGGSGLTDFWWVLSQGKVTQREGALKDLLRKTRRRKHG